MCRANHQTVGVRQSVRCMSVVCGVWSVECGACARAANSARERDHSVTYTIY